MEGRGGKKSRETVSSLHPESVELNLPKCSSLILLMTPPFVHLLPSFEEIISQIPVTHLTILLPRHTDPSGHPTFPIVMLNDFMADAHVSSPLGVRSSSSHGNVSIPSPSSAPSSANTISIPVWCFCARDTRSKPSSSSFLQRFSSTDGSSSEYFFKTRRRTT
ncbi:hypothetical protein BDY24DRAFT_404609 [Mrakia frigida]|uniref:uncharacterized protein n=1 Tax=Mrakia frigida TaxID=29902 RepID=UPI003FCC0E4C